MTEQTAHPTTEDKRAILLADGRQISLSRPLVMGVINVTPDSFSDGGRFAGEEQAVAQAIRLNDEGSDILDIGGESTRPGAGPVPVIEELGRVIPVIEAVRQHSRIPISIDTNKAEVARAALEAGADIVNDVTALRFDADMAALVAEKGVPVVLMHMLGEPRTMQQNPSYVDCVAEIADFFEERIEYAMAQGIGRSQLVLDPGIGFGKRLSDNLELLKHLSEFQRFGRPLLVGASRKSFIRMLDDSEPTADRRLGGSVAAAVVAVLHGADIVRVHDVQPTVQALRVLRAIGNAP